MRFFTLAFALVSATAIMAMPSTPETGVSFTFDAPSIHPNSTLEERTGGESGGGGGGGGKDHCKKERGRRPDTCGCYSGLDCHDNTSKCECGDQGNSCFEFCGSCKNDVPKCACKGENQSKSKSAPLSSFLTLLLIPSYSHSFLIKIRTDRVQSTTTTSESVSAK